YVPGGIISAVFDGHGGAQVSEYLKNNLVGEYLKCSKESETESIENIWKRTFTNLDNQVCSRSSWDQIGSTAVVCHIDVITNKIYLLAVGDSMGYCFSGKELLKNKNDNLL